MTPPVGRGLVILASGVMLAACSAAPTAQQPDSTATPVTSTTPTTEATPPGTAEPSAPVGSSCPAAADLPLRQRLQQTVMVWTDGTDALPAYVTNEEVLLGGVFVGGDATSGLTGGTYRALADRPVPLLVAVDDEGGQVQRIDALAGDLPSAADQTAQWSPARTRREARDRAEALRELGITMDLAPVVDLAEPAQGGVIGDRSYSTDPEVAARHAAAFGEGLQEGGVLPTLKHFPGHGRAAGDSHTTLPVTPPLSSLERQDLLPYRQILSSGSGPWAVMMGHLVVPGLTADDRPASLDPQAYEYLREEIGFTGLVVTDELTGMQAVSDDYAPEQAAAAALGAGADLLLLAAPGNLTELLDGLEARVLDGRLSEDRVTAAADAVLSVKSCVAAAAG